MSDARRRLPDGVERRVLSYLPLAHVYERAVVECSTFIEGHGRIFFTESLATFLEDLKRARPTRLFRFRGSGSNSSREFS